ncbi:MAG: hypothetical protein OES69_16895 [Myxococcales bacterium]|nr:hypothetical protein [Myxococcales bacterium]MDH3845618.1 hypothetical protein [Myxococcales bacterium]
MTKQVITRGLIVISALLVVSGCSKDKSNTAKDAKGDPVLVLDEGQEPRQMLRYKVAEGTTTTSNMDFGLASLATSSAGAQLSVVPGVRLHVVSGPSIQSRRGTRFDVRIIKAEALVPEGADPELARDLNQSASVLNNIGGWVEIDDRGIIQASELNQRAKRADVPIRLLVMIINARTSLSRVLLPAEPVGTGARWEARKDLVLYGFKVSQVDTYTLTERVGDELRMRVAIQQTAAPQTVTFDEEGIELTVKSFSMYANGEIIANLNALEANAAANGESTGMLTVRTVEGTEEVEIDRAFQVRMTVTYDPGATAAGAAAVGAEKGKSKSGY